MKYIHLSKIDSTNNYALKNINNLESETIIFADEQKAGKGRNGRIWLSPKISFSKTNLYCSILLKPYSKNQVDDNGKKNEFKFLSNIAHYTAVILCRVFATYNIDAKIKWPNDILINKKKIAGILCESIIQGNNNIGVVVGCGVNLNMTSEVISKIDQPATSLNIILNKKINRDKFLENFVNYFFKDFDNFYKLGFPLIFDEYKQKSIIFSPAFDKQKKIIVKMFDKIVEGTAKDIDIEGRLILLDKNNNKIIVNIGDVFF
jgi:BirA family biotin operon repressor/biotin-[acetyl-CoA-carboxylase] ligase